MLSALEELLNILLYLQWKKNTKKTKTEFQPSPSFYVTEEICDLMK